MSKFRYIYIEITNNCNLSCPFCPSSSMNQGEFLTVDKFKLIINNIKEYTKTVYFHVKGEPLLHNELEEFIKICNNEKIDVCITTNGVLLESKKDVLLKYSNIKKINISLQSLINFNLYDQMTYLNNLKEFLYLKQIRNPKLGINLRIWNDKNNNKELNNKIEKYLEEINIENIPNVRISYDDEFEWPSLDNEPKYKVGRCLGGVSQLAILVNGIVTICCLDHLGKINLGNIFEESLSDILNKNKYLNIKKGWNKNISVAGLCQRCSFKNKFRSNKEVNS